MKKKVILYRTLPEAELARLRDAFDVVEFPELKNANQDDFLAELSSADGLIGAGLPLGAQQLDRATQLKAISTISVGTDAFDLDYLSARSIPVMHTPTVLTETTADTIFTLILCTARRAIELDRFVRQGEWHQSIGVDQFGSNVHGKTLGILGLGRIGTAVARRGHHGFGMNIQYYNTSRKEQAEQELGAKKVSFDELIETSDFICSVLPYTEQTDKLFNKDAFNKMRSSAFFINGGRGKTVDEAALIDALKKGVIKGAGLDVYEKEPLPISSELIGLDNVVLFPHVGSATHETRYAMAQCAVDNLINALEGNVEQNCANIRQLKQ
ncbi:D-glycerate dehydrogenase [Vibrio tritonius]|uniref:D-glycerate dehydrogenase n=1 Tax=Vibrio tritonius TaxID=1435069 RepID=A0ABS7YIR5_9VIBR|nr:D-glycerate dehydrogenase [Vibrio tritonius]MCA2015570.1 D-glycerate dehydrogenase [Vibrio tritonius]